MPGWCRWARIGYDGMDSAWRKSAYNKERNNLSRCPATRLVGWTVYWINSGFIKGRIFGTKLIEARGDDGTGYKLCNDKFARFIKLVVINFHHVNFIWVQRKFGFGKGGNLSTRWRRTGYTWDNVNAVLWMAAPRGSNLFAKSADHVEPWRGLMGLNHWGEKW